MRDIFVYFFRMSGGKRPEDGKTTSRPGSGTYFNFSANGDETGVARLYSIAAAPAGVGAGRDLVKWIFYSVRSLFHYDNGVAVQRKAASCCYLDQLLERK